MKTLKCSWIGHFTITVTAAIPQQIMKSLIWKKELYEAKVEYILLDCEDGSTEGRYKKVTFKQKSDDLTTANADKLKISSEDARVFQFKIYTLAAPSGMTKDNKLNNDLLDVFQRNHTFVSKPA